MNESINSFPFSSSDYSPDSLIRYAKLLRKCSASASALFAAWCKCFTNVEYLLVRQFRGWIGFSTHRRTNFHPSLPHCVLRIIFLRSNEKMAGIDTSTIIACVAHTHSIRNGCDIRCDEHQPMCSKRGNIVHQPENAVTGIRLFSSPFPTLIIARQFRALIQFVDDFLSKLSIAHEFFLKIFPDNTPRLLHASMLSRWRYLCNLNVI